MFWLGLILPICHWLSLGVAIHFGITAHSLTGPWFAAFLFMAFWFGAASPSLDRLWRGLAVGLSLSSAATVAQALGWDGIPSMDKPAGLFYNSTIQAIAIALVIVALKDWRYIPAMLPGLVLSGSRGGWLVLAVGLMVRFVDWRYALLAVLTVAAIALTWPGPSDQERLMIWGFAAHNLDWFGHGQFATALFYAPDGLHYPGHAHNDYLQLAYELGIWAVPVYLIYVRALWLTEATYWPAFVGFAVAGLFFFPLYAPLPAFIGAVLAGHILRPDYNLGMVDGAQSLPWRA